MLTRTVTLNLCRRALLFGVGILLGGHYHAWIAIKACLVKWALDAVSMPLTPAGILGFAACIYLSVCMITGLVWAITEALMLASEMLLYAADLVFGISRRTKGISEVK